MDDVGTPESLMANEMMSKFPWTKGRVVVTTRSEAWSTKKGFQGLHVESMSEAEALALVRDRVHQWSSESDVEVMRFVTELGAFPLALSQACATCASDQVSFATPSDYIVRQKDQSEKLARWKRHAEGVGEEEYPWGFLEMLLLSLQEVKRHLMDQSAPEEAVQGAMRLLRTMSWLLPTGVPVNLLGNSGALAGPVKLLGGQGLVTFAKGCLSMHPLVQQAIRREDIILQMLGGSVETTLQEVVGDLKEFVKGYTRDDKSTFDKAAAGAPHVLHVVGLVQETVACEQWPEELDDVAGKVAGYLQDISCAFGNALVLRSAQLAYRTWKPGHDHVDVANTQYNMALVHKSMNKQEEAKRLFLRCAEVYAKVYGADHSETLDAKKQAAGCSSK
mmetsp:Transcript_45578/g.109681  ORF Transcript_45578/g.109681 Transcript_45578/m.109681 type:complete len:390 (-) Transcript_45578:154-1323(-)